MYIDKTRKFSTKLNFANSCSAQLADNFLRIAIKLNKNMKYKIAPALSPVCGYFVNLLHSDL